MLQARFKDDLACGIREGDEGPRLDCCVKDGGGCLSNFNVFNSVSGPYEEEPGCYEEKMEELHARGAFWVHYHPLGSTANQRARQVDSEIQRMLESYYVCYTPSWW